MKVRAFTVMVWFVGECMKFPRWRWTHKKVIRSPDGVQEFSSESDFSVHIIFNIFIHLHLVLELKVSLWK